MVTVFLASLWWSVHCAALTTKLRVAYPRQLEPFQFADDEGNALGRHVDLLNAVAQQKNYIIEYHPMDTKSACFDALQNGKIDLVMGVMEYDLSFYNVSHTAEISSATVCLAARTEIAQLYEQPDMPFYTGVMENGTMLPSLLFKLSAKNWILVDSQTRVLETQLTGEADLIVGVKNNLLYQLREKELLDDYTIIRNSIGTVKYYIVASQNDADLIRSLNDGIASLRANGTFDRISDAWVVDPEEFRFEKLKTTLIYVAVAAGIVFSIYFASNLRARSLLKSQVEAKTRELTDANDNLEKQLLQTQYANNLRNQLIERSHSGMVMVDNQGGVTLMNHNACLLAGVRQSMLGEDVTAVPVFGEIHRLYQVSCHARRQQPIINEILTLDKGLPGERSYRCSIYQAQEYQAVTGAILVAEDITEEEKERAAAFEHEKSRALNRIVAGIAHEIKNPLMSIRTFATLVAEKRDSSRAMDAFSQYVPGEVERINRLVESLINYAKPARGSAERVNAKGVLEECAYLARATIGDEPITIRTDFGEEMDILADKDQLRQIFLNIVINGVESMREKLAHSHDEPSLALTISTRRDGSLAIISIRDEGMGMSDDQRMQCTEPFFTTKARGAGMGLAVTAQFVRQNGGELNIQSREGHYTEMLLAFACVTGEPRKESHEIQAADY